MLFQALEKPVEKVPKVGTSKIGVRCGEAVQFHLLAGRGHSGMMGLWPASLLAEGGLFNVCVRRFYLFVSVGGDVQNVGREVQSIIYLFWFIAYNANKGRCVPFVY